MENATGTDQRDESAVAGGARVDVAGFLDRAADQLTQAACALEYSSRQEAQVAKASIGTARVLIEDALKALR